MVSEKKYLLGLDAGNTVIKAVVFDHEGNQLAVSAKDGQSSTPQAGHVERSLPELWKNAAEVIKLSLQKAGIDASQLSGIGCAGHGNGLYLLDESDEPLLAIQSLDTRAVAIADELSANGNGDKLHSICLQKPWPSQTPTLLAWVKKHDPELYSNIGTVFLCKDFISYKLTGRKVSDISDLSGAGMVRMPECVYDDELWASYGLTDCVSKLPDIVNPNEVIGQVTPEAAELTGLVAGTPVVGGFFDVVASALGSGVVNKGQASIICGTWSINQVIDDKPVQNSNVFMASAYEKNRFLNIEASATSAANLEWYVKNLIERGNHIDAPFDQVNDSVARTTPSLDDPFYHPYLYGSGVDAKMLGGYYGLAGWHNESHMLRALFEGVVFEHKRHIDVLKAANVNFDSAILSGGGSRSPVWPQMFADILNIPVQVAQCQETGALGAAIAAGVGVGIYANYETAVGKMTKIVQTFTPDQNLQSHYATRYELFESLTTAMQPIWQKMSELKNAADNS